VTIETLMQRRDRILGAGAPLFYRTPVHIVRGESVFLFDADGRQYLDMYNNVPCVGHANPHVVEAMARQAGTLNVHSRYLHEGILAYGERLLGHHDDSIENVVFACSGTEANEIAMMMARQATGGRGFICTDAAYHGNSAGVRRLTRRRVSGAEGEIRAFPFAQSYRPIEPGLSGEALTNCYLAELERVIDGFKAERIPLAGLLVCSIFANEGLPDIPPDFMPRAAEMVRAAGGLVIADEVQAGLCRTGRWWGYEVSGFVPDIVTMGKPLGNGLPLAAAAARRELVETFRAETRYFNTFASSPLQAAVGSAVLDVIEQEDLGGNARDTGGYLLESLKQMTAECPSVGDVRGHGLFLGIEWVTDRDSKTPDTAGAADVANRLKDKGVLLGNAGANGNIVKIRPPLVFSRAHADQFLSAFSEVLGEVHVA